MQIQLPPAADVAAAVELWSGNDQRLAILLKRYGEPGPALRHYGLVLWEGGQLQAASQAMTGAAALRPDDARVWSDLGSIFNALGHPNEASACIERSLAQDPTQAGMWLQLGSLRAAAGDGPASVDAFRRALDGDVELVDAWVGLGLAYYGAKRFRDAIGPFHEAIQRGKADDPAVQGCLGEALYAVGDFVGAAVAYGTACRLLPDNQAIAAKRTRAQFAVDVIEGTPEQVIAMCQRESLRAAEGEKTIRDAFHLLSAYGYREAAVTLGEWRLARFPDDTMQAYLLATLKGEAMARAPDGYIINFFDQFADEFEHKLVDVLGYRVPGELAALAQDAAQVSGQMMTRVLDLGCGTGLVGSLLSRPDRAVTGVDLSPRMLDKARQAGHYEVLVEAELESFLAVNVERYGLVVAADVLIYFGDLLSLFVGVARALEPGGFFAASIETVEDQEIVHRPSGRFAHSIAYVERIAGEAGLQIRDMRQTTIRLDANGRTLGALVLMSNN